MRRGLALAAAVAALALPAAAQAPAEPDGSAVVEALEVIAQPPGPALWRVTRGQSEVIILGGVTPLPHSLVWDTRRVEAALEGAKALLIPPRPRVSALDFVGLAIGGTGRFKTEKVEPTLEQSLPEPLRNRFVAARTAARKDADRYARWKPQIAGVMLVSDLRDAAGLSSAKPASTVVKLARYRKVPVRSVGDFRLLPLAKDAAKLTQTSSLSCLEDALTQVEAEGAHAQDLARAWAAGDLKAVRTYYAPPALERCVTQAPRVADLIERGTQQGVEAILQALASPGKTVAVIDLNYLLRRNGVLDRLKARGAEITVPLG